MQPPQRLTGVGKTAIGVAMVRARETRQANRLFDDPYAEAFLAACPDAFPEERQIRDESHGQGLAAVGAAFFVHGALRTRFFDDHLLAATTNGCHQVVLLAAGLDTRAFRVDWPPGTRLFELDFHEVLAFKNTVLAAHSARPRCERVTLPTDLRGNWASELDQAGFDPSAPTAWLAEGLLIYLSADEAGQLLGVVDELSAAGSTLSFEHGGITTSPLLTQSRTLPAMRDYTELWKGGLGDDTVGWLDRLGWRTQRHDLAGVAAHYNRPVPDTSTGAFITATRDQAMQPSDCDRIC